MSGINYSWDNMAGPMTDFHAWYNDFDFYLATDWVITETGSGTRAISQAKDGLLLITNAGGGSDANFFQARDVASGQVAEHWKYVANYPLYFGIRFKVSDATLSSVVAGLQITDTSPLAVSDGIFFLKSTAARTVSLAGYKGSTGSTVAGVLNVNGYLTDDTFTTLEFLYDGTSSFVSGYQDGVLFGGIPLTNMPNTEELTVSFGIQNGEAVAKTMTIDWIRVMQKRTTP